MLFINAVNEVERKNAQSYLEERHIARIATAYDNYVDDADFAKVATIHPDKRRYIAHRPFVFNKGIRHLLFSLKHS